MKHFNDCINVAMVKKLYRELALVLHPDRGGELRAMQELNAEYLQILQQLDGRVSFEDGKERTYKYDATQETEILNKINALISLRMANVEIIIIGSWIWINGATRPFKDKLRALNCKWHNKRGCWFFHQANDTNETRGCYRRGYSKDGLDKLAQKYGYQKFSPSTQQKVD